MTAPTPLASLTSQAAPARRAPRHSGAVTLAHVTELQETLAAVRAGRDKIIIDLQRLIDAAPAPDKPNTKQITGIIANVLPHALDIHAPGYAPITAALDQLPGAEAGDVVTVTIDPEGKARGIKALALSLYCRPSSVIGVLPPKSKGSRYH